ncbi:MAG: hypothetical protein U1F77_18605 [Kiritimatiellia bacterium]
MAFKMFGAAAALWASLITLATSEARRIERLPIKSLHLADVPDGTHPGAIVYQNQLTKVSVITADRKIRDIQIVHHLPGKIFTNGARESVSEIVRTQTLDATKYAGRPLQERATNKALLLAVQAALDYTPLPADNERSPSTPASLLFFVAFVALCSSLGTQLAGYLAYQSGNPSSATHWVGLEDLAFFVGVLCILPALLLTLAGR